jgi:hypothetical protein
MLSPRGDEGVRVQGDAGAGRIGLLWAQVCGPRTQSGNSARRDGGALLEVRAPHPSAAPAYLARTLADAQDGAIVRGLIRPDGDVICLAGGAVFVVDP